MKTTSHYLSRTQKMKSAVLIKYIICKLFVDCTYAILGNDFKYVSIVLFEFWTKINRTKTTHTKTNRTKSLNTKSKIVLLNSTFIKNDKNLYKLWFKIDVVVTGSGLRSGKRLVMYYIVYS